jgi:hypothetical protein
MDFHHRSHPHPHKAPADLSRFWVLTCISNAVKFKRRYELYWQFKEMCDAAGVKLITVEQAFGNRDFMVTQKGNPLHVQVRTVEELWHKENMINIGINRMMQVDPTAREVAWVDADCAPMRTPVDWFEETWHQLQHFELVQMWEKMIDLDIAFNPIAERPSFMYHYFKYGEPNPLEKITLNKEEYYHPTQGKRSFGAPGLAWAANVDALNKLGGQSGGPLLDKCILGAGDWYMAHALIGSINETIGSDRSSSAYAKYLLTWQERAERWIKRDVGVVGGTVYHYYHGDKINRKYGSRGAILTRADYDPDSDVKYDSFGLLQLETWTPHQIRLRDEIRKYMRERNEDSCDLTTPQRN